MTPESRAAMVRARDLLLDTTGELLAAAADAQPPALRRVLGALADALAALASALGDLASVDQEG